MSNLKYGQICYFHYCKHEEFGIKSYTASTTVTIKKRYLTLNHTSQVLIISKYTETFQVPVIWIMFSFSIK